MLCNAQLVTNAALHHLNICHLAAEMFSSGISSISIMSLLDTMDIRWRTSGRKGYKGTRWTSRREEEGGGRRVEAGGVLGLRVEAQGFDWMPRWPMAADLLSSPSRQPLTPMKRGFSVPNDHMAEGDEELQRGGGGGGCSGQRGRISGRSAVFIMHQIRRIHHLSSHQAQHATQLSLYLCRKTSRRVKRAKE